MAYSREGETRCNQKYLDDFLPHLFSYREVPQESTKFSPFELLYGRRVHGPLCVLKEEWSRTPIPTMLYKHHHTDDILTTFQQKEAVRKME